MAKSGLPRIDGLFEGAPVVAPVGPGEPDKESVGASQDLLRGQGQPFMPSPVAAGPGKRALVHRRRWRRITSYVSRASQNRPRGERVNDHRRD